MFCQEKVSETLNGQCGLVSSGAHGSSDHLLLEIGLKPEQGKEGKQKTPPRPSKKLHLPHPDPVSNEAVKAHRQWLELKKCAAHQRDAFLECLAEAWVVQSSSLYGVQLKVLQTQEH